ncbi:MAG: biopolymer transporter ExbD [Rhodocyclaceae bacterium]|nr:biopolymer transporter ExbD [Rhodocyclaceae bacterium]
MSLGGLDASGRRPMAEINMTPLVDVMLVLLVIFIVTAPLMAQALRVDVPRAAAPALEPKPDAVRLALDRDGKLYWNDAPVADEKLPERLASIALAKPQPELRLAADRDTRYQRIADILSAARAAGVAQMGFETVRPEKLR